jgi:hypothetical protein
MRVLILLATLTIAQLSFGQTSTTTVHDNDTGDTSTITCHRVGNNTDCSTQTTYTSEWEVMPGPSNAEWKAYHPFMKTCKARGIKTSRFQKMDEHNACYSLYLSEKAKVGN